MTAPSSSTPAGMARRRPGRRYVGALLAALVLLLGMWTAWTLSRPAAPGIYLARLESSQMVFPRPGFVASTISVLWVPRWPWEATPEFGEVSLTLADGSVLPMASGPPTFTGLGPCRTGYLSLRPTGPLDAVSAPGPVQQRVTVVTVKSSHGELKSEPPGLYVVRLGEMVNERSLTELMTSTFLISQEVLCLTFSVRSPASVEVLDILLPPETYPLKICAEGSPDGEVSFPLLLEPGHTWIATSRDVTKPHGTVVITPVFRIRAEDHEGYYCLFSACFRFDGCGLEEAFDLRSGGAAADK